MGFATVQQQCKNKKNTVFRPACTFMCMLQLRTVQPVRTALPAQSVNSGLCTRVSKRTAFLVYFVALIQQEMRHFFSTLSYTPQQQQNCRVAATAAPRSTKHSWRHIDCQAARHAFWLLTLLACSTQSENSMITSAPLTASSPLARLLVASALGWLCRSTLGHNCKPVAFTLIMPAARVNTCSVHVCL